MKKLFLFAALALFALNVNAQEEKATDGTGGFAKSDIYLSGTVGINTWKQDDAKSNSYAFMPSVGYFLSDNIALELGLSVGGGEDTGENKTNTFGANLGARYFFTPANQFSFTVGAGFGYMSSKYEPNGGDESKTNTFGFSVAPGLNYFVSNCFALRASIGALSYTSEKGDWDGAEAANSFGFNLDLSDINFGVTYKF
ncbi:outer membrane beta-barrel protein [Lacinutrix iliipiscaria]|uniref:Outer membrane beta-barrel protein n=1 Tax=Lacinutrix iliipiscaria TaxID=1230532 RepID=A0ABW5WQY0_9FLAO